MTILKSPTMLCALFALFVMSACSSESPEQTTNVDETVVEIMPTEEVQPTPVPTLEPTAEIEPSPVPTLEPTVEIQPSPEPTKVPPPTPGRLTWHGMVYDDNNDRVIITGGRKCAGRPPQCRIKQDAWVFDVASSRWEKVDMGITDVDELDMTAFNLKTNELLVMALKIDGTNNRTDNTFFIYNTGTEEVSSQDVPEAFEGRIEPGMVYHPVSEQYVLFGGQTIMSPTHNDTWLLDTNTNVWKRLETNDTPQDRGRMAMIYDSDANKILLHGGSSGDLIEGKNLHDTWELDIESATWSEIETATSPQLLAQAEGAYDVDSKKFILFGKSIEGEHETWAFDYPSKTWTKMNPPQSPIIHHAGEAVYSPALDRVLTYGGAIRWPELPSSSNEFWAYDFDNDIWEVFDGMTWQPLLPK